jgi:hypothetical protein
MVPVASIITGIALVFYIPHIIIIIIIIINVLSLAVGLPLVQALTTSHVRHPWHASLSFSTFYIYREVLKWVFNFPDVLASFF